MKSILIAVASLAMAGLLTGCVSADRLNDVRIGMTKDQVVAIMGRPDSTSAQANVAYLTYYLSVSYSDTGSELLDQLRVGMTKDQVAAILGRPDSTSAQGEIEYMVYYVWPRGGYGIHPYVVRLVAGKTESFGRIFQLDDLYDRPLAGAQPDQAGYPPAVDPRADVANNPGPVAPNSASPAGNPLLARPYMVRLVDGRVESYGRFLELFDVNNRPVTNALPGEPDFPNGAGRILGTLVVGATAVGAPPVRPDLAGEVQKLQALRDQGALTDQEFKKAKAKLLGP